MDRLWQGAPREPPAATGVEHFVVSSRSAFWYVSTEMARHIEACLDAPERPEWVRFVDIVGARVRIRASELEYVTQSTRAHRAAWRAFRRMLDREEEDEPGEDGG